ncbi:MAG: cache domain-containing protein [Burkholderiales bacterium]|nr:cache domain-containing protein [Burkholderiales bacterium]
MSLAQRLWRAHSIRTKLLVLALLPLFAVLPVSIAVLVYFGGNSYDRLLNVKVQSDLAVAHSYFERVKEALGRGVEALANSAQLERSYARHGQGNGAGLAQLLAHAQRDLGLDFLLLYDAGGQLLASSGTRAPQRLLDWKVTREARSGKAATAIDIFSAEQLAQFDTALAERALTPFIATENATPSTRAAESRGMVIHAAAPVRDASGAVRAVVVGGSLLNKNLDFVDGINEIVYPDGALPFGSQGTATLFLDDVRVATNVRLFEGARAIGTRVSQAVRQAVLGEGRTWLDSAFVVNDWYVSAYEPVLDGDGQRVGMLYVGYLEKPFRLVKQTTLAIIIGVFLLAMGGATLISLHWARGIFKPIERMHATMSAAEGGDDRARVGAVPQGDEIGELAAHLDRLLDQLQAQKLALRQWGEELDQRVADRTRELAQALDDLRSTQRQLVTSEKLAAVGQLTAGVAHEINNPIAVIQGNIEVLADILGTQADPVREEIRLIRGQVHRIRLIVTKLLQFARPAEFAGYLQQVDASQVVQDSLVLVGHQMKKANVAVVEQYRATQPLTINPSELQQVLINLMVNALQAMPGGGTLTLSTHDWVQDGTPVGVRIDVADSGAGMAPEVLAHIFNPFFTTKKAEGTGLGLWVSLGLVERYGGRISADSTPGLGATFTVWLLREPEMQD